MVYLDNQYLDDKRSEGLLPKLDQLAEEADDPVKALATSKAYFASQRLRDRLPADRWQDEAQPIGAQLTADLFTFRRQFSQDPEEHDILEMELLRDRFIENASRHVEREGKCSTTASTNPMVRSMRRLSSGGAWDETLATTISFARSTKTFWP